MTSTVLTASLFTLIGVILTVTANFIIQQRQHDAAIRKARFDILGIYAQKLEHERLERYPALYSLLSSTIKQIDYPDAFAHPVDVRALEQALSAWDSSWGLLLTEESGGKAQSLREILRGFVRSLDKSATSDLNQLRPSLVALEIALRVDLGVYAVEFAEIERNFRSYDSVPHPEVATAASFDADHSMMS